MTSTNYHSRAAARIGSAEPDREVRDRTARTCLSTGGHEALGTMFQHLTCTRVVTRGADSATHELMSFIAAAAQLTSTSDLKENLRLTRELAAQAAADGARLFALPECFAFLGMREGDKFPVTEVLDAKQPGPVLATVLDIASEHGMWVSAGGIAERLESEAELPPERITSAYNTHIVVSPKRELVGRYRKIHLFDVDIPGKATLRESDNTTAGTEIVATATDLGTLGLAICYDLRFPELFRTLAVRNQAQVLLVPAAFTAHTGAAHWHTLLRARAIENQCWVIAAAQTGHHNEKRESYGHSLIIDPWGTVVAEQASGTGLAMAEIDLRAIEDTRQRMPCHDHQTVTFT